MQDGITMLMQPLQGVRLISDEEHEEGAIIGFRKSGDEVLFVSGEPDPPKGMEWIPTGRFSPNPEAVITIEEDAPLEEPPVVEQEGPVEVPSKRGPFGRNVRRRPELEG